MKEKSSNILIKTIIFALTIGLSCIIFFGLMEGTKTEIDYTAFGLILFAEFIVYLSIAIAGCKKEGKLNGADIISFGVLYFITNIITNWFCLGSINTLKLLIIINAIEMIIFVILICLVALKKNNN